MQKWEYLEIQCDVQQKGSIFVNSVAFVNNTDVSKNKWDVISYINEAGEEGWELSTTCGPFIYLKRPKAEE